MFIKATYGQKGRIGFEKEWRARKAMGGGELLDQGVHVLDLCRLFVGGFAPESTRGVAEKLFWQGDVDDNAFFVAQSTSGIPAFIHVSSSLWRNTFRFEVQGTHGRIEIEGIRSHYGAPKLTLLTRNEQKSDEVGVYQFDEKVFTFPDEDATWAREIESFLASVREGALVDGTPEDALVVLEVVFALYAQSDDKDTTK
jgi:predicted dehydrogenase